VKTGAGKGEGEDELSAVRYPDHYYLNQLPVSAVSHPFYHYSCVSSSSFCSPEE
jgi:hypothetical protein